MNEMHENTEFSSIAVPRRIIVPRVNSGLNRSLWEERARRHKSSSAGVLFEGLPPEANDVVHSWHRWLIDEKLGPTLMEGGLVMDVGCGFGRLSQGLGSSFPSQQLFGLDFVFDYARQYEAKTNGRAVVADLAQMPVRPRTFDAIICVTALMYLSESRAKSVVADLIDMLRPGGVALFVEPGAEFLRVAARLRRSSSSSSTGGRGIAKGEFYGWFAEAGALVLDRGANRGFTAMSPLLAISRLSTLGVATRPIARRADRWPGDLGNKWCVHRWALVQRPHG